MTWDTSRWDESTWQAPPVPLPLPTPAAPQKITYLCTDLTGTEVIADLPFDQVTFGWALNGSGKWSGTLHVEDPRVQALDWIDATAPNKTCMWVDIDGALVWGGIIQTRRRSRKSQTVQVTANDHWSYLGQRVQAKDYSTLWSTTNTGAAAIADRILTDILASANSVPISVSTPASVPSGYGVTLTWPRSQRMAAGMVVQQLAQMGWQVGFDYAIDVEYVGGVPTATITLSYPRRGRIAGTTGLIVDVTGDNISFDYTEDGSQQSLAVYEMGAASGGVEVGAIWEPGMATDGYPLLESVAAHSMLSPTPALPTVLQAMAEGDLSVYAYPVVTPTLECPMFSTVLPIGSYIVGDDINVVVPESANGLTADPSWPNGLNFYFRIVKADFTVPSSGLPTQKLTLAVPPTTQPVRPPS